MSENQQHMMVFVSHAHEDVAFCRAIVEGLRGAGADVWYDEHNLGSGQLMEVIQRELGHRPVVVVILSKAAFASAWVRREVTWAYELMDRDSSRLLLPITAGAIERSDFDPVRGWLFLHDFKRIEASGLQPYPPEEAVQHLLHTLALTPRGEAPSPATTAGPQPSETVSSLLTRGKALAAQNKYAEALLFFESATQRAPRFFDAWANLGQAYEMTEQHGQSAAAFDRALALDTKQASDWNGRGETLLKLKHPAEALAAFERAITLYSKYAAAWIGKSIALYDLKRYEEALAAIERAITLNAYYGEAWAGKGKVLRALGRTTEAEAAEQHAQDLKPF